MPPGTGVPTSLLFTPGSLFGSVLSLADLPEQAGSSRRLTTVANEIGIRRCLALTGTYLVCWGRWTCEPSLAAASRIEEVAQAVAEDVEGEDREGERAPREDHHPRGD